MLGFNRGVHFFLHALEAFFKCLAKFRIVVVGGIQILSTRKDDTYSFLQKKRYVHSKVKTVDNLLAETRFRDTKHLFHR